MKGVFKELLTQGITYAVVVSITEFICGKSSRREYFLIADKKNRKKLRNYGFYDKRNHKKVVERNLAPEEESLFRDLTTKGAFVKKVHTKHGRVYEINGVSFKESLSA